MKNQALGRMCRVVNADLDGAYDCVDRIVLNACFRLGQSAGGFRYDYSVYQGEYSRNLLFTRGAAMEQVFQGMVGRTYRVGS
jgi:hypothetical protein